MPFLALPEIVLVYHRTLATDGDDRPLTGSDEGPVTPIDCHEARFAPHLGIARVSG